MRYRIGENSTRGQRNMHLKASIAKDVCIVVDERDEITGVCLSSQRHSVFYTMDTPLYHGVEDLITAYPTSRLCRSFAMFLFCDAEGTPPQLLIRNNLRRELVISIRNRFENNSKKTFL